MATKTESINLIKSQVWSNNEDVYSSNVNGNHQINFNVCSANCCPDDEVNENSVEKESHENDDQSSSSSASEIAKLADVTISEDTIDDSDSACAKNITDEGITITNLIETAKLLKSTSIDLSKRKLSRFPEALSKLPQLEYMYLEGNEIASLPNEFFKMFPNLRWLDLRNNLLTRIPSAYLATHSCLRNLLLEGNNICSLPLELGLVKSLHGLNIAGNPLDFPPHEIIERGTQYTLAYLRDLYEVKRSQPRGLELKLSEDAPAEWEHTSEVSDDWNTTASLMDLAKQREIMFQNKSHLTENPDISKTQDCVSETKGNAYKSSKMSNAKKFKKMETDIFVGKKKKEKIMSWKVNPYPSLPTSDYVKFRMNEEKHLAKVKEQKRKIEEIIQKQKNEAVLGKWREVAKMLQKKKYSQRLLPGKDYKEPGEQAPFGIEMEMMKVLSKEDRLKADLEKDLALKQQRIVSPRTRARREQEKQNRIFELEARVKQHMSMMMERRKQPKGTPQHEKEVARKELAIAEQLYNELFAERRDIEYHIKTVSANAARANKPKAT